MLVGRHDERARIDRLLDEGAASWGGALVVRGEAGIGKTALLEYARSRAQAATVVSTTGVESEVELPFAGLADVVRPLLGCLPELPESQADVMRAALGLGPPRPIDRLRVGAATLGLLAAAAEDTPLLVLVDDGQWLDAASRDALVFAARRLVSDPVVVILAARDGEPLPFDPSGIETLVLGGLARDDAAALLGTDVPPAALDTLMELTRGNPLALIELPATLSEAQLLGRQPFEHPLRVGAGIERAFARRALVLGERVGRALLVAAADDSSLVEVVEESARRAGAGPDELLRQRMRACSASTAHGSSSATRSFARPCTKARLRPSGATPTARSRPCCRGTTKLGARGTPPRRRLVTTPRPPTR
jgi:AAA ATPase domain